MPLLASGAVKPLVDGESRTRNRQRKKHIIGPGSSASIYSRGRAFGGRPRRTEEAADEVGKKERKRNDGLALRSAASFGAPREGGRGRESCATRAAALRPPP